MLRLTIFALQIALTSPSVDSARVENGRLVVEPIGVSFEIPPSWLRGTTPIGGEGCKVDAPRARRINTERTSILQLSGPPDYFADHLYSALSDSAFPISSAVAHLGAHGWRECDNSVNDLQVRVYVTDDPLAEISARLRRITVKPKFRGYSTPRLAAPVDSAGWHIERFDYSFNCGDCIFEERVEILSQVISNRTVSLVLMYYPGPDWNNEISERTRDRRTILESFVSR